MRESYSTTSFILSPFIYNKIKFIKNIIYDNYNFYIGFGQFYNYCIIDGTILLQLDVIKSFVDIKRIEIIYITTTLWEKW